MNRPGPAAKGAPHTAPPEPGGPAGSPRAAGALQEKLEVVCPRGDARTSAGQPPGSRSLAFGEDEERGKKPYRIRLQEQQCSIVGAAPEPEPCSRLWTARFGDSQRDLGTAKQRAWCPGLLKGTLTISDPKKKNHLPYLVRNGLLVLKYIFLFVCFKWSAPLLGKSKRWGRGGGVGQGENSPCCLHALGLGQGTAKPPQAVPCPVSFLKRQLATARMEHPGRTTNPHKPHCWGCQRPPQTCLQDTSAPPRSPVPNPHHGNGPEDEGQLGQCRSQTRLSEQGGVGLDPGEQLLLELSGTEQDWGPTACRDRPSPAPYRGERKLLYLFCVGKSCFFTAPITGSHQPQGCAGKINTALFLSITKSLHKTGLGFFSSFGTVLSSQACAGYPTQNSAWTFPGQHDQGRASGC